MIQAKPAVSDLWLWQAYRSMCTSLIWWHYKHPAGSNARIPRGRPHILIQRSSWPALMPFVPPIRPTQMNISATHRPAKSGALFSVRHVHGVTESLYNLQRPPTIHLSLGCLPYSHPAGLITTIFDLILNLI